MRNVWVIFAVVICGICCGFDAQPSLNPENQTTSPADAPKDDVLILSAVPQVEDLPQPQNLLQVSNRIYSGGEPQGDDAFARLAKLGVRTVVSVDGAKPDVEAARKHGLRYIHIPLGYDGISEHAGLSLTRLVRDVEGPIFIHCHHGQHRAPTAAAVACIAEDIVDGKQALQILQKAGTGKQYTGLWEDIEAFLSPPIDTELPGLPETAEVDSLITAMVQIDRATENLGLCKESDWNTPPEHPDVTPAREALLLNEGFRESMRHFMPRTAEDRILLKKLVKAQILTVRLRHDLERNQRQDASKHFAALQEQCKRCHAGFRN